MTLRFAVLFGSVRTARRGIRVARFVTRKLEERGHQADLVDALEVGLPLIDRMYKEFPEGEAPEGMERVHDVLDAADGFVIVTAEYNHSVPPALKNLVDHYQSEFFFKPAAIVSYSKGSFGGVRVAPHWRIIMGELGAVTTSIMMPVPRVSDAFEEDGTPKDAAYDRRVARFIAELEWYADALKAKRAEGKTPF